MSEEAKLSSLPSLVRHQNADRTVVYSLSSLTTAQGRLHEGLSSSFIHSPNLFFMGIFLSACTAADKIYHIAMSEHPRTVVELNPGSSIIGGDKVVPVEMGFVKAMSQVDWKKQRMESIEAKIDTQLPESI